MDLLEMACESNLDQYRDGMTARYFPFKEVAFIAMGLLLAAALSACGPSDKERSVQHLQKGKELYAAGEYEAALPELKKAADLNIDALEPRLLLGNAYRALKRYDEALDAYRGAKKVDRYEPTPHIESALVRVERGEVDMAVEELNHAVELDPRNVRALVLLGKVSRMPRSADAKVELGRFVNLDPKAGLERAVLNLARAVEVAPDNLEANYELAKAYEEMGDKEKAVAAWKKTKELASNRPEHAAVADEASKALARLSR